MSKVRQQYTCSKAVLLINDRNTNFGRDKYY